MQNVESSSVECSRQGEITSEFARLNDRKEQLHSRIGILFDRLQDILRKPEPQSTAGEQAKETLSSQLAIDLSSISATTEADLDKINNIIDRLEL